VRNRIGYNSQAVLAFAFFLVVYALGSESNDQPLFLSKDNNQGISRDVEIIPPKCRERCQWTSGEFRPDGAEHGAAITAELTDYYIYRDSAVKLAQAFAFIKRYDS
jgi:hypothetical protein